jgi:cytoskeleton protein RodZ
MNTLGQRLRRARLEKGIEIRQIAEQLRISSRYIEAMETEAAEVLPGGIFSRSFYRQYAAALGVTDPSLEADILSALGGGEATPPPGQVQPKKEPISLSRVGGLGRPPARSHRSIVSVVLLLVVVAGCAVLYEFWQRVRDRSAAEVSSATPSVQAPTPAVASSPAPAPMPAPAPATQENAAIPEAHSTTPPPEQPAGQALNLSATEKAWVSVTAGGKVLFSGVMEPSETKQLSSAEGARLIIGNAGGVDVQWRGKSIGHIGPRGQVRIVVLTPQGAEILQPQPKKPSTDSL